MSGIFMRIIQWLLQQKNTTAPSQQQPSQTGGIEQNSHASLNLLYEIIHERLVTQKEQWMALDTKTNFILGYATALVSASLILQSIILSLHNPDSTFVYGLIARLPTQPLSIFFLIPLLVCYIATVIIGIFAYKPRPYRVIPEPEAIFQNWLDKDETKTRLAIVENMIDVFKSNQVEIGKKVRLVDYALGVLFVEAFLLVPLIVLQVFL